MKLFSQPRGHLNVIFGILGFLCISLHSEAAKSQSNDSLTMESDIGYSVLSLDDLSFTKRKLFTVPQSTVQDYVDHNGSFDGGIRYGIGIVGAPVALFGTKVKFAVTSFYAAYDEMQRTSCNAANNIYLCGASLLFDADAATRELAMDDGGTFITNTDRDVRNWGIAVEGRTDQKIFNFPLEVRTGLAYRAIEQDSHLLGYLTGDTVTYVDVLRYNEQLDTDYYGAYLGLATQFDLSEGLSLKLNGEIGIYYADVNYDGQTFNAPSTAVLGVPGSSPSQQLSLSEDEISVITKLRFDLEQNFGSFSVGIFALGEWYSYAPMMRYNDTDVYGAFKAVGLQDHTYIDSGNAWSYTIGGKVSIPLN